MPKHFYWKFCYFSSEKKKKKRNKINLDTMLRVLYFIALMLIVLCLLRYIDFFDCDFFAPTKIETEYHYALKTAF